ncbi:sensor histidine kinase [Streptomyces populi]|uniref:Sensor histidine kinase n=1 Tax=Streptomyces populi TaxID=2058924 RepID=A0A2I0SH24_9ACTN|nr:histidine kinase [Streptomyces populi]PKT69216.1 sensor histidine kinase [Streptomyces populi]
MGRPSGWWRGKSTPAKVETYTRWSFHFFSVLEAASIGLPVFGNMPTARSWAVFLLVCGHSAFCATTASRALDWTRGTRERPRRTLLALAVSTCGVAVAGSVLSGAPWRPASDGAFMVASSLLVGLTAFGTGTVALGTRDRRRMTYVVLGASAGAGVLSLPLGFPAPAALVTAVLVLLSAGFMTFTAAFSVWLLNAVYELDEARETRARLAVAEERLRFGRDLHDVMGRNLAVIALKSELAVQLARRGRSEAVDQMTEVQRIARESQREVRAVVRGYRDADLAGELAGAQGVLTAADIDCRITGTAAELPPQVQSALGWVVREATTNVLRHGNARRCALSLRVTRERVTLTVENDGVPGETGPGPGPDGGQGPGRGSGLAGLRERLEEVGGTLRAGADGEVFRLTAEVPLRSARGTRTAAPDIPAPDTPTPTPTPAPDVPAPEVRAAAPGDLAPANGEAPGNPPAPPVPHQVREATP